MDEHGRATRKTRDEPRSVALHPSILSEDETVELFTEVLNHVVTFGLPVDEKVEANFLLEADDSLNLLLDEVVVLLLGDLTLAQLGTSLTDLFRLLRR